VHGITLLHKLDGAFMCTVWVNLHTYRCSINGEHYFVNAPSAGAPIRRMCLFRRSRPKILCYKMHSIECRCRRHA
jgi:hypothetical protein